MTKDRMIEALEELRNYINREAVDVMNVNIKQVHAEALKQGIFELKKETVSRETYEWEYRIRKDLDNENAVLKERCKALEKKVEELKNGTTEKILIELPEDLYKSIMAHRSKTKFQEYLDYQTLKNVIECGRKIPDCEVQGMTIDDCVKELLINKKDDTYVLGGETIDFVINTMRKYQKIEDIYYHQRGMALENSLREVIEYGNYD